MVYGIRRHYQIVSHCRGIKSHDEPMCSSGDRNSKMCKECEYYKLCYSIKLSDDDG